MKHFYSDVHKREGVTPINPHFGTHKLLRKSLVMAGVQQNTHHTNHKDTYKGFSDLDKLGKFLLIHPIQSRGSRVFYD